MSIRTHIGASIRTDIAAVSTGCLLALGGMTVVPVAAASGSSSATAPQQLTNAYPLGPQRLCCNGQTGVTGQAGSNPQTSSTARTGSNAQTSSRPAVGAAAPGGRTQPAGNPPRRGSSGGLSAFLLIGFGAAAALLVASVTAVFRTRRASRRIPAEGSWGRLVAAAPRRAPAPASYAAGDPGFPARPSADRSLLGSTASASEEAEYRRLDETGDAGGAFNVGVVLHQRGDVAGAIAAYERAEQRGDPDAAFNLGVLLYESGDLDGAEAAWGRTAGRGHVRAAANLIFLSRRRREVERGGVISSEPRELAELEELSYRRADEGGIASGAFNLGVTLHQRGDVPAAAAAYERAEHRGDPDAAFNLGVLLYEAGDFDGAEAAWRRDAGRGHVRAAENLEFLRRRRRNEPERAGVAAEAGDE